ncbi:MAG: hypothetical protein HQM09_00555 [Candidatus Riflebacteria bacterium]|nr:hypothetical protein [Candidatus Riflebacteria bacterium]
MPVGSVSSSTSDIGALMKLLKSGQDQEMDLAKKLIQASVGAQVSASEAEGKGQLLDLTA